MIELGNYLSTAIILIINSGMNPQRMLKIWVKIWWETGYL